MSVPIAVTGLIPNTRISSGVIRLPPPMPVRPTRKPTPKPKKTIAGSTDEMGEAVGDECALLEQAAISTLFPFLTERVLKGSADGTASRRGFGDLARVPGALVPGELADLLRDSAVAEVSDSDPLEDAAQARPD